MSGSYTNRKFQFSHATATYIKQFRPSARSQRWPFSQNSSNNKYCGPWATYFTSLAQLRTMNMPTTSLTTMSTIPTNVMSFQLFVRCTRRHICW